MKAYPVELRTRIVRAVASGMAQTEAARMFAVSPRTIRRYLVQQG
jgi:transposase